MINYYVVLAEVAFHVAKNAVVWGQLSQKSCIFSYSEYFSEQIEALFEANDLEWLAVLEKT